MLIGRTSRFFGQQSPGKTFGDVAREINLQIERRVTKGTDVVLASYSIGCDGKPIVSLLDGSQCDEGGEGKIVQASRDRGVLSGSLPAPMRSNNPGTGGLTRTTVQDGAPTTGRYFVDWAGAVYEGRNGMYHAGYAPQTPPNGSLQTWTNPLSIYSDILPEDCCVIMQAGAASEEHPHVGINEGTIGHAIYSQCDPTSIPYMWQYLGPVDEGSYEAEVGGPVRFSPDFCFPLHMLSLEPFGSNNSGVSGAQAFPISSIAYNDEGYSGWRFAEQAIDGIMWIGRSSTQGGGYRISNTYLASVEGRVEPKPGYSVTFGWGDMTTEEKNALFPWIMSVVDMKTCLVFRDPTTFAVLGYVHLQEAEEYVRGRHSTRCFVSGYGTFPWRAGIVVRPAADGTWCVSTIDSDRAWIYEAVQPDPDSTALEATLLETVIFDATYQGAIRVIYK